MVYSFNSTWLPKTEEILKITRLISCTNFWIMIQAIIKCFGQSTDKRIWTTHLATICMVLQLKDEYGHSEVTWTQYLINRIKTLHKTGSSPVINITLEREEEKNREKRSCYNTEYSYLVTHLSFKVIWLYQLSWKCKLATVTCYKADVSSVSPSSFALTKG